MKWVVGGRRDTGVVENDELSFEFSRADHLSDFETPRTQIDELYADSSSWTVTNGHHILIEYRIIHNKTQNIKKLIISLIFLHFV